MKIINANPEIYIHDENNCPHVDNIDCIEHIVEDEGTTFMICEDCLEEEGYHVCDWCGEIIQKNDKLHKFNRKSKTYNYHEECYQEMF